jgi:hypothetical protein
VGSPGRGIPGWRGDPEGPPGRGCSAGAVIPWDHLAVAISDDLSTRRRSSRSVPHLAKCKTAGEFERLATEAVEQVR